MNTTPNINLSTYTSDPNDKFNLLVTFNNNMSKIDTAVGAQNDAIDVIEETASTAVSTANTASTTATGASTTATQALDVANSKPSINDTVAGATSTYSSNKINALLNDVSKGFPDYQNKLKVADISTLINDELNATYNTSEDCYVYAKVIARPLTNTTSYITFGIGNTSEFFVIGASENLFNQTPIFKVKANTNISCTMTGIDSTSSTHFIQIYKIPIIN